MFSTTMPPITGLSCFSDISLNLEYDSIIVNKLKHAINKIEREKEGRREGEKRSKKREKRK